MGNSFRNIIPYACLLKAGCPIKTTRIFTPHRAMRNFVEWQYAQNLGDFERIAIQQNSSLLCEE